MALAIKTQLYEKEDVDRNTLYHFDNKCEKKKQEITWWLGWVQGSLDHITLLGGKKKKNLTYYRQTIHEYFKLWHLNRNLILKSIGIIFRLWVELSFETSYFKGDPSIQKFDSTKGNFNNQCLKTDLVEQTVTQKTFHLS